MKRMKKLLTLVIAFVLTLAMTLPAAAQDVATGKGGTGSITIKNASKGQTYTVYKLFDATVSDAGTSYKLLAGKDLANNNYYETDTAGNVKVKTGVDMTTQMKTKEFHDWAVGYGENVKEATADDSTLKFTELQNGYYFVKSSLGAVATVDNATPNVEVIDKNTQKPNTNPPDPQDPSAKTYGKHVVNGAEVVAKPTAMLGQDLDFQIKFRGANFETVDGATKPITAYTIVDTPTDLAIKADTVKVFVGGAEITNEAHVAKNVDSVNGKLTVIISDWNKKNYDSPVDVVVTYKATVKNSAVDGAANNSVSVKYTTDPTPENPNSGDENPDNPVTPNPNPGPNDPDNDFDEEVKTYGFQVKKVNPNHVQLSGAEFELYDAATDGNKIEVVKTAEGEYRVKTAEDGAAPAVKIQAGLATIKGLKGNTKYYLQETKAPDGYNVLTVRTEVSLETPANPTDTVVEVINQAGATLPATGGIGTTIFYVLGAILVLGASVVMISRRRMSNR